MPFPSNGLGTALIAEINAFATNNNFPDLYRSYRWENDTHANQFPNILELEIRLSRSDTIGGINLDDVKDVAKWGSLRNAGQIAGPNVVLPAFTLHTAGGGVQAALEHDPVIPIAPLQLVHGIGPTYQSKVLRFGMPAEYGAIDTRCVRVFGQGDPTVRQHNWLRLTATRPRTGAWSILEAQTHWPNDFSVWINILRLFAQILPNNCPHPPSFISSGVRSPNRWTCADVEMALFTYASSKITAGS